NGSDTRPRHPGRLPDRVLPCRCASTLCAGRCRRENGVAVPPPGDSLLGGLLRLVRYGERARRRGRARGAHWLRSRFDISSRSRRSSLVRLPIPRSEILSSTRFSSSVFFFPTLLVSVGLPPCRLAAMALLRATISSISFVRSRERGCARVMARGVSSE